MSPPIRTIFFGDSICFGQGVSLHNGWVTQTSAALSVLSKHVGRELLVVNASVNGNTTRQALERMPYDVQSHGVDVLLVQFGLNDCNYWRTDRGNPRVSLASFEANLDEIIDRAFTFGARTVLLNTNHPTLRDSEPMEFADVSYEESNRRYNDATRRVVARRDSQHVLLNDVEDAFDRRTGGSRDSLARLLLPDRLHPNESGHDLYFEVIFPVLEQAVTRLAQSE